MSDWDAGLYRRFEDERTRPARDLLDQVGLTTPRLVYDLGCGPGNSTELLRDRYPDAEVIGLDRSEAMLTDARARLPDCRFIKADIATWTPETPPDLIYANAALQWVGAHETLFPRLLACLAPEGVLAVQMPDNREEPSHRLMREVAGEEPWRIVIGDAAQSRIKILPLGSYYDLLIAGAGSVDLWRTTYNHPMDSAAAIVSWVSSTGLRPFTDPLPDDLRASFLASYEGRIAQAYQPRRGGKLLLAFPRLFLIARRAAA